MKKSGVTISFDVNYRAALQSEDEARELIKTMLPLVDILFVSEETSRRMMQKEESLYGILSGGSIEESMAYENALSVVKNTVLCDMSISSIDEVNFVL